MGEVFQEARGGGGGLINMPANNRNLDKQSWKLFAIKYFDAPILDVPVAHTPIVETTQAPKQTRLSSWSLERD